MKSYEIINKNIIKYCAFKNISYSELSIKLGKPIDFMEKVLTNKYKLYPNLALLQMISTILNIPIEKFFEETEELYNE